MRRKLFTATLTILIFSVLIAAQPERQMLREGSTDTGKRIALVIGNANYQFVTKLDNPVNDATDMAAVLKTYNFDVISGTDLTRKQLIGKIREFGDKLVENGGVGFFFYAGHGVQVGNVNYLVPVDADIPREDEVSAHALEIDFVFEKMRTANNGFNFVVLDACRNNPFSSQWKTKNGNLGLAPITEPVGTLLAYATQPNTTASDGKGRNGLYTKHLLDAFRQPNSEILQVFGDVGTSVKAASAGKQVPWFSSSLRDKFFLYGKGADADSPAKNEPISLTELIARWKRLHFRLEYADAVILETTAELALNPKNAIALRMRSSAYYAKGDYAEGKKNAEGVLEALKNPASSDDFEAICYAERRLERHNDAVSSCTKAITLNRNSAWAHNNRGTIYLEKKLYDLAIEDYNGALAIDPKYAWAYTNRAAAYLQLRQPDLALADYNKAIEIDASDSMAYRSRGEIYRDKNQIDLAIRDLSKSIELDPKNFITYGVRGMIYEKQQRYELAAADYGKIIELNPQFVLAYGVRAEAYIALKKYDLAISDYSQMIAKAGGTRSEYMRRAFAYSGAKQHDLAIADYSKAIELDSKYTDAYNDRGTEYTNKKEYDRAIADFSMAIELDPRYTRAYRSRAYAYQVKGDLGMATADRKKADEIEGKVKP